MKRRIWLIASVQLILVLAFGAVIGTLTMSGCGGSGDGEVTPDISARLETEAREAARAAEQALHAATGEVAEAARERTEPVARAPEAGDATADVAAGAEDVPANVGDPLSGASRAGDADCLELVDEGAWAEAVSACTQALSTDPQNPALRRALDEARGEVVAAELGATAERDDALGGMR